MNRLMGIILLVVLVALTGCKRKIPTSGSDSPVVSQDSKPAKNAGTNSAAIPKNPPPQRKLEGNAEKIIGVWSQAQNNPGNTCTIEFCRDGSFKVARTAIINVLETREWIDSQGTYEVDGDKIKMLVNTKDGLRSRLLTIKKVESDVLVTFERAPVNGGGFATFEFSMPRVK